MYIKVNSMIINNDELNTYSFDKLNNKNDIINLLYLIEKDYGQIYELTFLNIDNNKLIKKNQFNSIKEINENNVDFTNYNIINFSILNKNIIFTININTKEISINILNNTLNNKNQSIKYYKNKNNKIIKFDPNSASYYFLNKQEEWQKHNSLISQFYDGKYDLEEIYYDDFKKAI